MATANNQYANYTWTYFTNMTSCGPVGWSLSPHFDWPATYNNISGALPDLTFFDKSVARVMHLVNMIDVSDDSDSGGDESDGDTDEGAESDDDSDNAIQLSSKIEQIKGIKPDSESSGEKIVRIFLEDNKIKFKQYHKMKGCFSEKNGKCYLLTFDFFIPSKNLVIEYDGGQHFAPVSKFGGQETFERTVMLDGIKNKFCEDNGIKMLRIPYTKKKNEVYQILKKALGLPE
jgi:very-short-patch-repair endonuclease